MVDCEICGQSAAKLKARIDNVVFSVCIICAKNGEIVEQPRTANKPVVQHDNSAEEIIVVNFNRLIQQARSRLGLRQEELATRLHEKLSVLQSVESGKREPDLRLARKLEKALNIVLVEEV